MKNATTINNTAKQALVSNCRVIDNRALNEEIYKITIHSPEIAKNAFPGQFVSVLCNDLMLRRPFSIASCIDDQIEIIYKIKGKGTEYISSLKKNNEINIMGPLGKKFNISEEKSLLVGGGVGTAPLVFLSKVLKEKNIPHAFVEGYRTNTKIGKIHADKIYTITEDGSSERKGLINDYTEEILSVEKPQIIYACGPLPVLEYIVKTSQKYNIQSQVALEREFACGVGVCMGCSIKVKENGSVVNKRICKDGPVFDGESLLWN